MFHVLFTNVLFVADYITCILVHFGASFHSHEMQETSMEILHLQAVHLVVGMKLNKLLKALGAKDSPTSFPVLRSKRLSHNKKV